MLLPAKSPNSVTGTANLLPWPAETSDAHETEPTRLPLAVGALTLHHYNEAQPASPQSQADAYCSPQTTPTQRNHGPQTSDTPPSNPTPISAGWVGRAKCKENDPEIFFPMGRAQNPAKAFCATCPVKTECLAEALDNRIEFGVWGGMTERERRALLRRRPNVASWWQLLTTARDEAAAR